MVDISAVLPILLLGGKVVIVGAALSTLMLVLGTVVVLVAAVLSTVAGEMVVVIAAKLLTGKTTQVMVTVGATGRSVVIVLMMDADVSLPRMAVSLFSVLFSVAVAVL